MAALVFAGAIERAALPDGSPMFWFKGGLTTEARFGNTARAARVQWSSGSSRPTAWRE